MSETRSPRIYRVIVPVPDLDEAVQFYSALLDQTGERVAEERHYFRCGDIVLACVRPGGHDPGVEFRPNPDYLYLAVDDLDAWRSRAASADARIESEIETRPWGERSFYIRDPFENPLCFVDEQTLFLGGRFVE